MDTAVALVQAYLNLNGYFTVTEYPVLEAYRNGDARCVTDLDILAFRFAGVHHPLVHGRRVVPPDWCGPDPLLQCPADRPDMIVGEVKEGPARFNRATRDPQVLAVALGRFGCCSREDARETTRVLLTRGCADTPAGHAVRMVAFGDADTPDDTVPWTTVPMRSVVEYLRQHLHQHWDVLRHAQIKDSALGVLALLEKWRVDTPVRR